MSKSPCLNPFEHILHVSVHDKILRKWNGNLNDLCSKSLKPRQALYDSVHSSWRTRDKWISVEEAEAAWFHIFQRGHQAFSTYDLQKPKLEAAKFLDVSTDLPYPCGHPNCTKFHDNTHGFCDKHRFRRVWWNACSGVMKACHWMELVLLLTIQAAADIQSRILLLLILVSLLPVTCIFLKESTGMSASSICVTWMAVAVGTCLYTAKRLDGMQQSVFQMALATEAQYYQVLQPEADTNQHLVQLSTILSKCSDGSFQQVLQTEQDLRRNYELAKSHMSIFQTVVCKPLASTGLEVVAKIKSLTELDEREGGADILFCEVWCDSLQEVQDAWDMLKDLDGVEIVSARDFFAVASYKKSCKVVVSLQGYLATVVLMEKSLSSWEAQKGLSDAADSLGLLDKTKASAWEVSRLQRDSEVPRCVFVATAFLRLVALYSCYIIGVQIGGKNSSYSVDPFFGLYDTLHHCTDLYEDGHYYGSECGMNLDLRMLAMTLPFLICFLILLWEILSCCCCCLCCCKRRRSFKIRPRPTQLWYRTYLGCAGIPLCLQSCSPTVLDSGDARAGQSQSIPDHPGYPWL